MCLHVRSCRLRRYRNAMIHLPASLPLNPNSNSISPLGTLTALWETLKNEANFSWTYCSNWKVSSSFAPPTNVFVLKWVWICRGMSFFRWLGLKIETIFFLGCVGIEILAYDIPNTVQYCLVVIFVDTLCRNMFQTAVCWIVTWPHNDTISLESLWELFFPADER